MVRGKCGAVVGFREEDALWGTTAEERVDREGMGERRGDKEDDMVPGESTG